MGGKNSKEGFESSMSLNKNERRRLTHFLESRGSRTSTQFTYQEIQNLWKDTLVPDLLKCYAEFTFKKDGSARNYVELNEFVSIYVLLVRGTSQEKASTLADIIGITKNSTGQSVVSFRSLFKYLSDMLESYFLGVNFHNDNNYRVWVGHSAEPKRPVIEQVMTGFFSELQRKNDEVGVDDLERWLNHAGTVSLLHSYVLGSLYNLEPEVEASIIPHPIFATTKTRPILNLCHVVYINSFLAPEHKIKWKYLFSTSTHGESFSKLVGCISNQGPLILVVCSNKGNIFGGFISTNIAPGPRWVGSEACFLFQLSPSVEVYPSTGYNDHYSYLNMNQTTLPNGLGMGGQFNFWGLWIDSQFGKGECSESCTTFKNYKMLASQKQFVIGELEVWGVGDPPPSAEERGERTQEGKLSILDRDDGTSNIMEMSGHKFYSKNLKEPPKE